MPDSSPPPDNGLVLEVDAEVSFDIRGVNQTKKGVLDELMPHDD